MNKQRIMPLAKPITATISIPGSKSYTNRALLLAAMTPTPVTISNPLKSDDTRAMISCLKTLGIEIVENNNEIIVKNDVKNIDHREYHLNANLSGTTIRFILALATVIPGIKIITGEEGLNKRPIADLVDGLKQLGADIEYLERKGYPPVRVNSSRLAPGTVTMNGNISSQYFSALLMIAPQVGDMTIAVVGEQISKPYIDMTIDTMKQFGVDVQNDDYKRYIISAGQTYKKEQYTVEGDFSSAGYFLAIAALTSSTITLENLNPQSKQADRKLVDVLAQMGNIIHSGDNSLTIVGKGIRSSTINVIDFPDQGQTLAVLAAFAEGTTTISGVQSLRVKETERVIATQQELAKMGIKTEATNDTLTIYGGNPKPATIDTYGDHRMAMAFAVAGTKLAGMEINDPEVVNKTFPEFWKKLKTMSIIE